MLRGIMAFTEMIYTVATNKKVQDDVDDVGFKLTSNESLHVWMLEDHMRLH